MGRDPNLGREAIGMGRQGFVEKKKDFLLYFCQLKFS